ncbi:MAG: sigma-54-dependent Fis family transcriptional regulator [Thermoanaerobaculia bacterium]|nr:MAG: sigma-54-dependent Fis family transcriptional regulator [Thermoanaerobaculia bacterium]
MPLAFHPDFVLGDSPAMRKLLAAMTPTVCSHLDVLIVGETGTGKELIAEMVHASGPTAKGPFVAINCAAIPNELLEAELFGIEARVATGVDPRPGVFVKAHGGSLFLDEIGDMADALQAKLLRALEQREVLPLGGQKPRKVELRVISASNKPIGEFVQQGRFRPDLYYRLRGLQFHVPPLRERAEDVAPLALAFAERAARRYGKRIAGISRPTFDLLLEHLWPGNVRELKSEVERAVLLCPDGAALDGTHFGPVRWQVEQRRLGGGHAFQSGATAPAHDHAPERGETAPFRTLRERFDEVEREALREALNRTGGNQTEAAKLLGITRNGLAMKVKRLGARRGRGTGK